jgi:hypothetical protein
MHTGRRAQSGNRNAPPGRHSRSRHPQGRWLSESESRHPRGVAEVGGGRSGCRIEQTEPTVSHDDPAGRPVACFDAPSPCTPRRRNCAASTRLRRLHLPADSGWDSQEGHIGLVKPRGTSARDLSTFLLGSLALGGSWTSANHAPVGERRVLSNVLVVIVAVARNEGAAPGHGSARLCGRSAAHLGARRRRRGRFRN